MPRNTKKVPANGFWLAEDGRNQLHLLSDQIRLVARLIEPSVPVEETELVEVDPESVAQGLKLIAGQIDGVLQDLQWPAALMDGNRKRKAHTDR